MNTFKELIKELKKFYVVRKKESNALDKYRLSNSYQRIAPYLDLEFESLGKFKTILNEATKKVYNVDGLLLSDKQIIELEYKKVKEAYDAKKLIIGEYIGYSIENIEYDKLNMAEYYFAQLKQLKKIDDDEKEKTLDNIKLILTQISILLGVENGLYYETFVCFTNILGIKNILETSNDMSA